MKRQDLSLKLTWLIVISLQFCVLLFLIGLRDSSVGSDTAGYAAYFQRLENTTLYNKLTHNRFEPLFVIFVHLSDIFDLNLFAVIFSVGYLLLVYSCVRYLRLNSALFLITILYSTFFYYNLSINTIRQYLAINFLVVYFLSDNKPKYLLLCALMSHYSSILVILSVVCSRFASLKVMISILIVTIVLSATGIWEHIILSLLKGQLIFKQYEHIVREGAFLRYDTGFRPDFIAFTLSLIGMLYFLEEEIQNLKILIILSSIFIFFTELPYSDRVGVYAWVLILVRIIVMLPKQNTLMRQIIFILIPIYCYSSITFHPIFSSS